MTASSERLERAVALHIDTRDERRPAVFGRLGDSQWQFPATAPWDAVHVEALRITKDGELVLSIAPNGEVSFGDGFTADEASRMAIEILGEKYGEMMLSFLSKERAENQELRQRIAELERQLSH